MTMTHAEIAELAKECGELAKGATPGPWWIWKLRAGEDEIDVLDDCEHDIMAGNPSECTAGCVSGADTVCHISDMDDANEDPEKRLNNALLIAHAGTNYKRFYEALTQLLGEVEK